MLQTAPSETQSSVEVVPLKRELALAGLTIAEAYNRLGLEGQPCFIFERKGEAAQDPYAYLFFSPQEELTIREGSLRIRTEEGEVEIPGNPVESLKRHLESYALGASDSLPPFACGAVGYLGYD